MQRDFLLREVIGLLMKYGFKTSQIYDRSCFDIIARKERLLLLLLKVLINIDSFTGNQAEEMKKIASAFLASPLIVGIKSKKELLEEDVVYERYGIPTITPETLKNMVVDEVYPEVFADRGGYFVRIDAEAIKEIRKRENLSIGELANIAHVSRETIYKYEHEMVRACLETAILLESILNTKITLSADLFKVPDIETENMTRDAYPELAELGFGVIPINRAPFDALAKDDFRSSKREDALITNMEKNRDDRTLRKIAIKVKDLSDITETNAVFIFKKKECPKCIEGIPVVRKSEIEEMENSCEFLNVVKERKEYN